MGLVIDTSTVAPHERTELWSATTGVFALSLLLRRPAPGAADAPATSDRGSCRCTTPRCPSGCARTRRSTSPSSRCPRPCSARRPTGSRITARWGFSSPTRFSHAVRADLGCASELRAAAARRRRPS